MRSFDLVDKAMDGRLEEWLREQREAGQGDRKVAEELRARGYSVSHETVRTWRQKAGVA